MVATSPQPLRLRGDVDAPNQVLGGQLWSIFMRDWEGVPKAAVKMNILSIVLIIIAVSLIAVAGAVM